MRKNLTLSEGLDLYREKVSILKKGYAQESYRIAHILKSPIASKRMRDVTSPDIADYRDDRLKELNQRTGKSISPATVRSSMVCICQAYCEGYLPCRRP